MAKTTHPIKKTSPNKTLIDIDKLQKITSKISKNFNTSFKKSVPTIAFTLITIAIIFLQIVLLIESIPHFRNIASVKATQIWPSAFDPIARFVANVDWDNSSIKLDASMSKAFEDKIDQYIWRIDDGHSITGTDTFEHTFQHPGYYLIQLSIVDQNGQSDVATCQLLIPPKEVEQIETSSQQKSYSNSDTSIANIDYIWAPKGTFYNYSKLPANKKSYADIKSRYIESGCGLSNTGYNISDVTSNISLRNSKIRKAVASLVINVSMSIVLLIPYLFLIKKYRQELKKK